MTFKVLGQSAPAAATNTDLYTVPGSPTRAVCSTLTICNRGTSPLTYRVAVRPAGAAIANQHYLAYNVPLAVAQSDFLTIGITLGPTDVVTVWASSVDASFNLFGDEA